MSRMISFVVLVAILLVIAGLFFRVMSNFLLPVFLAVLLAVMFGPLHRWFIVKCRGYDRVAAGLTTAAILLIFLVPLLLIILQAISEGVAIYHKVNEQTSLASEPDDTPAPQDPAQQPSAGQNEAKPDDENPLLQQRVARSLAEWGQQIGLNVTRQDIEDTFNRKVQQWVAPIVLSTAQFMGNLVLGLFVMIVSLYYFLADGPRMVRAVMQLSPLDARYEEQLIDEFENISRAVVLATVVSALVQGILAGIGFYVAGVPTVFLLTVLTMLFAMVPFVGAAAVWIPVCLYVYFFEQRTTAAVLLAIYGAGVVSVIDNIIKPVILHGRSNLHPLLALLSVLGGVQALGPIGIFVGPMVVAFLYALLNMLHTELSQMGGTAATPPAQAARGKRGRAGPRGGDPEPEPPAS